VAKLRSSRISEHVARMVEILSLLLREAENKSLWRHKCKQEHNIMQSCPTNTPKVAQRGEEVSSYLFLTSALNGNERLASHLGSALPPRKGPPVPTGQKAGWASEPVWTQKLEEKFLSPLPGIEPRSPGHPVRSQTLYWLSYPAQH
jgi:hypothetical protein